jgi:hypothetical protein
VARIQTRIQRLQAERERKAQVARALLEAEPAATSTVSKHVSAHGEQLPRIPVIGMEAGAIRGTSPHHARID